MLKTVNKFIGGAEFLRVFNLEIILFKYTACLFVLFCFLYDYILFDLFPSPPLFFIVLVTALHSDRFNDDNYIELAIIRH